MCRDFCHQFWLVMKSEAHETLSLLLQQDGVLHAIIFDNAKEKILGEFNRKLKKDHVTKDRVTNGQTQLKER